ncbi:MAG: cytochrome b [Alphaproteobacteria bacterium]
MSIAPQRYNSVAITLHWVMALGLFIMLGSGFVLEFVELERALKFKMFQWHKSGGVILLIAFGLRILWRIISQIRGQIPHLPENFPKIDRIAAHLGHLGLYALMIAMPLSGWAMVSSSNYGLPTIVFGWFEWPHIPGVAGDEGINKLSKTAHGLLAYALVGMIVLHVAAVVKHAVKDHENLLTRMWWKG